ncbi:MAG: PqqD family protein [Pseudomonadota bacterium]
MLPDQGDKVYALNSTGAAIWRLCDGKRTLPDIFSALRSDFQGEDLQIMADLNAAILQFREMNLLEPSSLSDPRSSQAGFVSPAAAEADRRRVRILHGIEDRPYFHWQLAIMFESLIGQLPPGWDVVIVVCNNHQTLTPELEKILDTYAIEHFTGDSPADNYDIDFADGGDRYVPMNRVEALNVIRHHVGPDDLVCLMDTDIFLYGELQASLFPKSNAMASNWIIGQDRYYHFSTKNERGLSLPKLLEALGYEEQFKPGGVIVFLTGDALQAKDGKLVKDCFRFLQILYLAAKILELPPHGVWVAEMACFALAMYPSGIDYELLDIEQFDVQDPGASELPQGSFCHYYADKAEGNGGPFAESEWHKQLYTEQNFLVADIKSFLDRAQGPVEKRFMELALMAKERLYGKQRD